MKVRTRLFWFGVAAPALGLVAALSGAGWLFRHHALASVDRELVARAAVESVGAFDGSSAEPHLHLGRATFPPGFVELDPRGALYDEHGVAASDPPDQPPIARGPFAIGQARTPQLWTAAGRRELALTLLGPGGAPYLLRLSCSLGPVKETLATYVRTTSLLLAGVVLALLGPWLWLARSLGGRLERITADLPRRDELPAWRVHEPDVADEISALDHALAEAFAGLRRAKDLQDEFIARAAHELRTPLGVMAAEMDLALSRPRANEELQRALAASRGEVQRLAELSSRLLDLTSARGVQLDSQSFDLVRVLYDVLDHASPALEQAQIKIRAQTPAELQIQGDPWLVRQAIENLLGNALRYSPLGGTIALLAYVDGAQARLELHDQGPGIPEPERARVFEPFVRGSNAQGSGTGLGLAIVSTIAQRMHGVVEALPSEHGARLRLSLPLAWISTDRN